MNEYRVEVLWTLDGSTYFDIMAPDEQTAPEYAKELFQEVQLDVTDYEASDCIIRDCVVEDVE